MNKLKKLSWSIISVFILLLIGLFIYGFISNNHDFMNAPIVICLIFIISFSFLMVCWAFAYLFSEWINRNDEK